MVRVWNTPILAVATVYFIMDGIFTYVTRPIAVWLSKKKLFEVLRRWVTSFGPYGSLALFAVPVLMLEPAKPLSGYLLATGHFFYGALVFITAEVLKLTVVERLFHLNKKKLLSIRVFAWGYGYWRWMMNLVESSKAWRVSRSFFYKTVDLLRSVWLRVRSGRSAVAERIHQLHDVSASRTRLRACLGQAPISVSRETKSWKETSL